MSSSQIVISPAPEDAISAVKFSPDPSSVKFAVSSWDRNVYLYELVQGPGENTVRLLAAFEHRAPVLDVCFGASDDELYTAGLDWDVGRVQVSSSEHTVVSTHEAGVRSVVYNKQHSLVVSASWDSTLHVHPARDATWAPAVISLPSKPFSLSISDTKLVVAMASRVFFIYELETLAAQCVQSTAPSPSVVEITPWQHRESSLKFMTRAVACMPNGDGYASSSIEGRVAVEWFDPSEESQARKYAFKCHRQPVDGVDVVYPVNALAFHPLHGTFASGGGDGVVAIWDGIAKRRIRIYPKYASSVAAMSFSSDGKYLAVAVSPGFEDGKDELPDGSVGIFIRELGENEAKRKAK